MSETPFRLFLRLTAKEGEFDQLVAALGRIVHVAGEVESCAQYEVFANADARSIVAVETFRTVDGLQDLVSRIAGMREGMLQHAMHGTVTTIGDPGQELITGAKEAGWDRFDIARPLRGLDRLRETPGGRLDLQTIVFVRIRDADAFIDAAEAWSEHLGADRGVLYHRLSITDASHACLLTGFADQAAIPAMVSAEGYRKKLRAVVDAMDVQDVVVCGLPAGATKDYYDSWGATYYEPEVGFSRLNAL
ncbi:MAG TPA: hypothetical protein VGB83_12405 [Actinomycetota bacterium]